MGKYLRGEEKEVGRYGGGKGDALLGVVYIYCTVRERTGSRV